MGEYNKIKSKFVREKIKNASYKRSSDYIEDLKNAYSWYSRRRKLKSYAVKNGKI